MNLKGQEITIIGAGIGGLAAAIALAQKGADVRVLEQAPELSEVGAGLQISPNGVAVLRALGVADVAKPLANVPRCVDLRKGKTGRLVARVPLAEIIETRHGNPFWQFHRADLLEMLLLTARKHRVYLRTGAQVTHVTEAEAAVHIGLADGTNLTTPCLIAADGVRSPTRAALFAGEEPRFTGQIAWRGLIEADNLPKDLLPNAATVFMGPGRHLVAYPLRGGTLINIAAFEQRPAWVAEGWTHADDPKNLQRAFEGWCPQVTTLLAACESTFIWGLFDHPALPRWTTARTALLGDACHPMLPTLAQGAVMALEDAWVLAQSLANATELPDGLLSYARQRKPRTTRAQKAARTNACVYHAKGPLALPLHFGLAAASRLAPERLLGRFDWLYGHDVTSQ